LLVVMIIMLFHKLVLFQVRPSWTSRGNPLVAQEFVQVILKIFGGTCVRLHVVVNNLVYVFGNCTEVDFSFVSF